MAAGGALAACNWLADLGCLLLVARSLGLSLGVVALAGAYLTVQLARQIPLTPGGVGVVEASLLIVMTSAGAPHADAAAALLLYWALSYWLLIPVGAVAWLALETRRRQPVVV